MTEQEWLTTINIDGMLRNVKGKRKLRLFGAACCREVWHLLHDESYKNNVLVAERFADGLVTNDELEAAALYRYTAPIGGGDSMLWAAAAAAAVVLPSAMTAACRAASDAAWAIAANTSWLTARTTQCLILRDIANPFFVGNLPTNSSIVGLATAIYEDRDYSLMPILGDALEDAGCTDHVVLGYCRSDKSHFRGCWVVDKILGKE